MNRKLIAAGAFAVLSVSAVGLAVAQGGLIARVASTTISAAHAEPLEVPPEVEAPADVRADYRAEKRYCRSMQGAPRKACLADAKLAYERVGSQAHRGYQTAAVKAVAPKRNSPIGGNPD